MESGEALAERRTCAWDERADRASGMEGSLELDVIGGDRCGTSVMAMAATSVLRRPDSGVAERGEARALGDDEESDEGSGDVVEDDDGDIDGDEDGVNEGRTDCDELEAECPNRHNGIARA